MRDNRSASWNPLGSSHKDFERFWQAVGFATALAVLAIEIMKRL
jgi:hypothetical protein